MFARKASTTNSNNFNNNNSMQNSRSRKSLGRTEKTFYKKWFYLDYYIIKINMRARKASKYYHFQRPKIDRMEASLPKR
jgi:hypothetical protein